MKFNRFKHVAFFTVIGLSLIMGSFVSAEENSGLNVGLAAESILPSEPVQLGGYGLRTGKSQGVRSDIFARTLYLEQGKHKVVWIVCDLIAFEDEEVHAIQNKVHERYGISPDHVLVSATHTHTGPNTESNICADKQMKYINETLLPQIAKSVDRAIQSAQPCRMVKVEGHCEIAHDRLHDPVAGDGGAPRPDKSKARVDYRVPAIGFVRADGSFKGVLVQYAMHPTSWSDLLIGAEWPGAVCKAIQAKMGKDVEPFVLQGAAGNLGSPKRRATPEEIQSWGDEIVDSFVGKFQEVKPSGTSRISFVKHTIPVSLDSKDAAGVRKQAEQFRKMYKNQPCIANKVVAHWEQLQLARVAAGNADHVDASTTFISLNDCTFVTVPFEAYTHLIDEIIKGTEQDIHLVAYTNGVYNYLPNKEAYDSGGYGADTGLWFGRFNMARGSLESYAQDILRLLKK